MDGYTVERKMALYLRSVRPRRRRGVGNRPGVEHIMQYYAYYAGSRT